jgi:ABC-2 type transport system permease protein
MRLSKAWTVASKDFLIFTRKRSILFSIIGFEIFVSVGLPLLVLFIGQKPGGASVLTYLIASFSFWLVTGAALLPVGIASYSLVGEKVQKSLEPLLATPVTDAEILTGKVMAAFIPAMLSNYLGAILYMVLVDVFTRSTLTYRYYPNWDMAIILLLLAPLSCLLSTGFNILISSRFSDIRAAQQTGALVVLPFGAVYVLSEINVFPLTTAHLLLLAAAVGVIDVGVFFAVKATFRRDEILTRWR